MFLISLERGQVVAFQFSNVVYACVFIYFFVRLYNYTYSCCCCVTILTAPVVIVTALCIGSPSTVFYITPVDSANAIVRNKIKIIILCC